MSKSIALGLVGAGAVLLAILLTGCTDAPSPTTEPTATPATVLTPTPEPTPTPAAATLSLGVYLTLCAPTEEELADDTTYGDFSSLIRAEADRFEALTPPAQLSEWHLLNIEAYRAAQAGVDTQPQDDVVDFDNPTMNAVFDDFEEKLREAAARLPEDVLQRMIEAGCIASYLVPDDYEAMDVPDDHGNSEGDATAIGVGTDVRGALDYDGDIDFFRFQAERGQSYQIDVAQGTLDDSELVLLDPDGRELAYNDDYGDTYASRLYWEAPSSGERYVLVGGWGIGTYTLTVSLSDFIDDHGNDFESATRIAIREAVAIELENHDDIDELVFRARLGTEYVVTLHWESYSFRESSYTAYPLLAVYDTDGTEHTSLMGYDFSRLSVPSIDLQWQAVTGGDYYIVVGDGNTDGTAALIVTEREATEQLVRDDHGDSEGGATAIRVGADVRGALDYDDDIDFFRFQAERGQSYQIDVALGTLDDSIVELYDYDGLYLDSNDDYSGSTASQLSWQASSSGELYVAVAAFGSGIGTYTLTVAIVDDHGDDIDDATVAATPLSLDEYLKHCPPTQGDLADEAPFGDYSAVVGAEVDRLEALTPPAELAEWHSQYVESFRTVQAFVDLQPKDDVIDIVRLFLMAAISADLEETLGEISARLPEDVRQQMIAVGCIDPEDLPDNYEAVPDDRGNNFDSATRIGIGETVAIELEDLDEKELLVFLAEPGRDYVITLVWETYQVWGNPGSIMALYDAGGRVLASLDDYDFSEQRTRNKITWQAVTGGGYYILVGDENTLGSFTLTVTEGGAAEPFVSVSAGGRHTCGVKSNGSVACWGSNADGRATPPAGSFLSVSARHNHTCGLRSNGSVACWGDDFAGEATPPAGSFLSVSAGWLFTCGVRSNGSVSCWGWNESGEATPPAGSFLSVNAGEGHTCGLRSNGSVACWGSNGAGQATPPAGSFLSVSAGEGHTCGVRSNGSVACWGSNGAGQATPPVGSFLSVSAGEGHTCGVRSNGSVACWGDNYDGEATPSAGSFVSVSAGFAHTCGVRSDGSVGCWGWNGNGQATPPE